jgi:ABC-2 type transport system permease protein
LGPLLSALIFGVVLGTEPESGFPLIAFLPAIIVSAVVADGFAGERERHTLETLLATPASDRALLLGKVGAYVGYGWAVCLVSIAVGAVVAAAAGKEYPPELIAFDTLFTLLVSTVSAALGVLVSLRAETVRAASRTLGLLNIPVVAVSATARTVTVGLGAVGGLASTAVLMIIAAVLMGVSEARFRRGRLLLD